MVSPSVFALVATMTSSTPSSFTRGLQVRHVEVLGVDAVERGDDPAQNVVEAVEDPRAFEDEDVPGLLDHAEATAVTARVGADGAEFALGQAVTAGAVAQIAHHGEKGLAEGTGLGLGAVEGVEGQALGRLGTDAGQARKLADETVEDGRKGGHVGAPRSRAGRAYRR